LEDYDLALRLSLLGPWAIIREPLVVKHVEAGDCLSVEAAKDPLMMECMAEKVIGNFLREHQFVDKKLKRALESTLQRVRSSVVAIEMSKQPSKLVSSRGRLWHFALRKQYALWRRTPWWPQAVVL
jgi:hypothetical protein